MLIHSSSSLKIILLVYDNSKGGTPAAPDLKKPLNSTTFTYNIYMGGKGPARLNYIIELLKAILEKKLSKKIIFIVRETQFKTSNAKIFADLLAYNIEKQPNKLKLLEKLIKH
jgi:hypothetical protein